LQDEFPDLTQKVFDALRPISQIAHGDSPVVVASVVLSAVRAAFVVLLQQDLIYSAVEVNGNNVTDPVTSAVDLGTLDKWPTAGVDLGSVEPEPVMPPSVAIPLPEAVVTPPSLDGLAQPALTPEQQP
jgi:hypothetical protein